MSQKVIELLNEARTRELTAITQYMAQHYELDAQGFGKVGSKIKEIGQSARESIENLLGGKVVLKLFVKVTPKWSKNSEQLKLLGYVVPER